MQKNFNGSGNFTISEDFITAFRQVAKCKFTTSENI